MMKYTWILFVGVLLALTACAPETVPEETTPQETDVPSDESSDEEYAVAEEESDFISEDEADIGEVI